MIKPLQPQDVHACVQLLMEAYNAPPWNNQWTEESAQRYLQEFIESKRFVGFVLWEEDRIVGATFGHEKTWWTADELFIDELFIAPTSQRKGYGQLLLQAIEQYCKEHGLGGYTLLTNRYMPAYNFYAKNELVHAEHVIFMYKVV